MVPSSLSIWPLTLLFLGMFAVYAYLILSERLPLSPRRCNANHLKYFCNQFQKLSLFSLVLLTLLSLPLKAEAVSAPTNVTAAPVATSNTQINIYWSASTDSLSIIEYRIERCFGFGSCIPFAQVAVVSGTRYTDSGLLPDTFYSYRVVAIDAAGNLSTYSNIGSAKTHILDTFPPPPNSGLTETQKLLEMDVTDPTHVNNLNYIQNGLVLYFNDKGEFPKKLEELVPLYLRGLPKYSSEIGYFYAYYPADKPTNFHLGALLGGRDPGDVLAFANDADYDSAKAGNVGGFTGVDPMYDLVGGTNPPPSGTIQLPRTGQTTCYDTAGAIISCARTGQDGGIRAGVPWPSPRFTDRGDGTVTDYLTGLMWTKDANLPGTTKTWQAALDYVAGMNAGIYPNFGHTDWRISNINELQSLIDAERSVPALPSGHPFTNVQNNFYWSSTTSAYGGREAWGTNFQNGSEFPAGKTFSNYAWPVRSGQTGVIQLPQTSQTTCYDIAGSLIPCAGTRQDGDIQAGVQWPSPRFTDHGDGTVTDNLTGLMWTKDGNVMKSTWQHDLDYVAGMNAGINPNYGYSDWRLPNLKELQSVTDYGRSIKSPYQEAPPLGHPFIVDFCCIDYWISSTSYAGNPSQVWIDFTGGGGTAILGKDANVLVVWPVRAGQVGQAPPSVHSISGRVTLNGLGLGGVTVTLTVAGSATRTTAADGTYTFTGLVDGNYTLTPSLTGYTFTPTSRTVTLAGVNVPGQDFSAVLVPPPPPPSTHLITGRVTLNGAGLKGVTVTLNGVESGGAGVGSIATTEDDGSYSFLLENGSYTITPSLNGYIFTCTSSSSSSCSVRLAGADVAGQDFSATKVILLDPVPELAFIFNSSVANYNPLATSSKRVDGIAADGVAHLLIRIPATSVNQPFSLTLFNDQNSPSNVIDDDGVLGKVGDDLFRVSAPITINISAVSTSAGPMAFAIYRAPIDFVREAYFLSDAEAAQRTVTIRIQSGGQTVVQMPVTIARPPVVLIHGIWSDKRAWDYFGVYDANGKIQTLTSDSRFSSFLIDYGITSGQDTSADGFEANSIRVSGLISGKMSDFKNGLNRAHIKVAAVQVDAVTHSMGGNIVRTMVINRDFRLDTNFSKGTIHKLITLDTPHLGSKFADILYRLKDQYSKATQDTCGEEFADRVGIVGDAVRDFRTTSDMITKTLIQKKEVSIRAYVIAGIASADQATTAEYNWSHWRYDFFSADGDLSPCQGLLPDSKFEKVFGVGVKSDLIVSESSQLGSTTRDANGKIIITGIGYYGVDPSSETSTGRLVPENIIHAVDPKLFTKGPSATNNDIQNGACCFAAKTGNPQAVINALNRPVTDNFGDILP